MDYQPRRVERAPKNERPGRSVPESPEVPWVGGEIRGIEILRQAVPEEKRRADGDVAVTREITIDLRCIPIDGQQSLEPRMGTDGLEYRVDQSAGDRVGDQHLFHKPSRDQLQGSRGVDRLGIGRLGELR